MLWSRTGLPPQHIPVFQGLSCRCPVLIGHSFVYFCGINHASNAIQSFFGPTSSRTLNSLNFVGQHPVAGFKLQHIITDLSLCCLCPHFIEVSVIASISPVESPSGVKFWSFRTLLMEWGESASMKFNDSETYSLCLAFYYYSQNSRSWHFAKNRRET